MKDVNQALLETFTAELPRLKRFLSARSGCAASGEDLAQEAWIRLSRYPGRAGSAPHLFLWRIARNLAIDFARRSVVLCEGDTVPLSESIPDAAPTPEAEAIARSEIDAMKSAIAQLPKRRRDMFVAAAFGGESSTQIAARYGLSKRTVEMEIRRAVDHCAEISFRAK